MSGVCASDEGCGSCASHEGTYMYIQVFFDCRIPSVADGSKLCLLKLVPQLEKQGQLYG